MAYYPIIAKADAQLSTPPQEMLPLSYMENYSILGFRVDDCDHALKLLDQNSFILRSGQLGIEVNIQNSSQMIKILEVLHQNGLQCEIADVADGIYQG